MALGTCLLAWLTTVGATCGDTGQTHVTAEVVGHGVGDTTFESAGWSVTLTRADVAFGPAYFCATTAADVDLCPAAVAETLDVGVVDGLSADLQPLGILEGDTQTVRSATYDFGITWLATEPAPLPAREAPGGHSARFLGTAVRGADSFDFAL
ncbi:MAG: hypothetical protein KC417_16355, partial [Myxococcales bacterium]|nr:hypothetical protein [Myxococcales bacterium]